MMRKTLGALALVLVAAMPARAQQHDHAQMQQHGEHGEMMMQPGAHAALMHRQELGLSAAQVQRLTAIDSVQARGMRDHCARVRAAGGPNAQTHAALHGEMTALMQTAQQGADAVLTQAQKATLDSLHAAHHGAMAAHAGHDMQAMHGTAAAHDSVHAAHHGADAASHDSMRAQMHGSAAECGHCCDEHTARREG
jgi:hypothetical protein